MSKADDYDGGGESKWCECLFMYAILSDDTKCNKS